MLNRLSLNKLSLNRIDLNRIGGRDVGVSARPYIDPELLSHVKMAISTWGKTNDDPDRAVLKDLSGNGNDMRLLNFGFAEGSGYGLPGTDFEGALITDGIDDQIVSTKTIQEMLGGSNDITVVSMIYHINSRLSGGSGYTNYIDNNLPTGQQYFRNKVISQGFGKWGIYGYSSKNNAIPVPITNILGDKADYSSGQSGTYDGLFSSNAKFSPIGRSQIAGSDTSSCAWYWTILADKVLTTDEINQIIAYFNLDRPGQIIKPQLYCNIKKQGITNDNHAEFNDQLIDFVGGHNIQLNNISWEGESGINSYPVIFGANKTWAVLRYESDVVKYNLAPNKITIYKSNRNAALLYSYVYNAGITNKVTIPSFKMKVTGLKEGQAVDYRYISESERAKGSILSLTKDGIYDIPKSYPIEPNENTSDGTWVGILINSTDDNYNLTLEVLPTIENALCLDGISDFGKATGLPILKDYTVVAERARLTNDKSNPVLSKSKYREDVDFSYGAFIFEIDRDATYSYNSRNTVSEINDNKILSYQSKYIYNKQTIIAGTTGDNDTMWLATIRDNDSRFSNLALWSLMLFPYSLSEFLLERQLKKYKAGTLYPDMIEFRPVIKSNVPYSSISYSVNPGEYIAEGSTVTITITLSNETDKLVGVSSNAISDISISGDNGIYEITGKVTKSPQKISIAIDEYIRYEDIVWPYPSMIDIYNSETDYKYTWGDTLKVGSKFKFKDFGYSLLSELYETWFEIKSPNGGTLPIELNKDYEVYKGLSFVAHNTYKLDNNKPKCILSPSRLRIPNSSYKILGHIPDISGHGNHGVIHNSAYSGNSGANGQSTWILDDYDKNWLSYGGYFEVTDDSLIVKSDDIEFRIETGHTFPGGEVEVTGMREGSYITIYGDTTSYSIRTNGRHSIPYNLESDQHNNYIYSEKCKGVVIKGVAEHEGAFCLDGVEDYIDIPTTLGGKQVLMKTIWQIENSILYDQRKDSEEEFAIYSGDNNMSFPAYSIRNNGKTYIDGILNHYVQAAQLNNVCHNITITNELLNEPNPANPRLGANLSNNHYAKMALYDFILFDEISTDEKIRELNDVIGIEGDYVEKPEYYWDAHGKTNADPDKNTIKNRGTEQSLISNSSPTNLQTDWIANEFTFVNSAYDVDIMSGDRLASTAYEARFLTGQVIPAMQVTLTLVNSAYDAFSYMYVDDAGSVQRLYFNDLVLNEPVTVDLPKNNNNNTNTGFILEANNPNAVINVKVLSQSVNIENAFDLEANNLAYTDESGYKENGLYLDGVEDYLVNPNVPAFTDYTYIFKREILANDTINSVTMHKGLVKEFAGGFTVDYVIDDVDNFVYHSFGRGNVVSRKSVENSIIYGTTTSVNGITINRGSNTDDNSITIGKYASNYRKMVFCKLALFSKTIDMLSINMLRNLFELDEIIDLNNKLFKK